MQPEPVPPETVRLEESGRASLDTSRSEASLHSDLSNEISSAYEERTPPVSVELLEDANDGNTLYVRGIIHRNGPVAPEGAFVRLIGLREGEVIGQEERSFRELLTEATSLSAAELPETIPFSLALPSRDVLDYQVEVAWAPHLAQRSSETRVELVGQRVAREVTCAEHPCRVSYRMSCALENQGDRTVEDVVVAVGFVWFDGPYQDLLAERVDLRDGSVENVREIELSGIRLSPGMSRPINLNLGSHETWGEDEKYHPVIQVLSAR